MKRFSLIGCACIFAGSLGSSAAADCADLSLVLAIDASSSIDKNEFALQMQGYAAAFLDPQVQRALEAAGKVDVAAVLWASAGGPKQTVPWHRIASAADAAAVSESFVTLKRRLGGDTDIGGGLMAALDLLDAGAACSARAVVNVSGDGRATVDPHRIPYIPLSRARARADASGVTVNALAVVSGEDGLAGYYRENLITGPGAFVMEAADFDAFGAAIVQKLEREVAPQVSAGLDPGLRR